MAKKKTYVKVFTNADLEVYKGLYRVGGLRRDHLEDLGVNFDRLKKHMRDGYIVKDEDYYDRKTKTSSTIYKLTDTGRRKCREMCNVGSSYKSSATRHDLALADTYVQLQKQGLTERWFTEQDWRYKLEDQIDQLRELGKEREADRIEEAWKNKEISVPDGGYINAEGQLVAVEIITRSYKQEQIDAKHEFVQVMGVEYQEINIK